jgi:hypothetical protein
VKAKYLLAFLFVLLVGATMTSAELLTGAKPIGEGKFGVTGALVEDFNLYDGGATESMRPNALISVGCGLTGDLDLSFNAGYGYGGAPVISEISSYGFAVKYAVLAERKGAPVSVSLRGGYNALSNNLILLLAGRRMTSGSQTMAGIVLSKKIIAANDYIFYYGGLTYRGTNMDLSAVSSTQLDLTLGLSAGYMMVEYTTQFITPNVGNSYTGGQFCYGYYFPL